MVCQKSMISNCNRVGKPVITATQMLESMTVNPRPTRAEVSDVANAVLDGTDCVMLSGETAKGKYPLETVQIMANICREAESILPYERWFLLATQAAKKPFSTSETIASSAVNAAFEQNAKALIVLTNTGVTAREVARFKPSAPIFAVTANLRVARQLRLTHGVFPVTYDVPAGEKKSVDERIAIAINYGRKNGFLNDGDDVVCVHADGSTTGYANLLRVIRLTAANN
jgi:pyruvate kinase